MVATQANLPPEFNPPTAPEKNMDWKDLKRLAEAEGFVVTSTTGGKHNVGSKHYRGLAVDVRTRGKTETQIEAFIKKMRGLGIIVRDERTRPPGQKVWGGPHLHLEV
jgi:hypothetical protein